MWKKLENSALASLFHAWHAFYSEHVQMYRHTLCLAFPLFIFYCLHLPIALYYKSAVNLQFLQSTSSLVSPQMNVTTEYSFRYISNKMQHYTVYLFLENCSTCFGWYLHPSSGAHTSAFTACGTCQTVTATCRYRGRVGTEIQLFHDNGS
jgi:hypothetical protein